MEQGNRNPAGLVLFVRRPVGEIIIADRPENAMASNPNASIFDPFVGRESSLDSPSVMIAHRKASRLLME